MFRKFPWAVVAAFAVLFGCRAHSPQEPGQDSRATQQRTGVPGEVLEKVALSDGSSVEFILSDGLVIVCAEGDGIEAEALKLSSKGARDPAALFRKLTGKPGHARLQAIASPIALEAQAPACGTDDVLLKGASGAGASQIANESDFSSQYCEDSEDWDYAKCLLDKSANREFEFRGYELHGTVQLVQGDDLEILAQKYDSGTWQTHMKRRFSGEGTVKSVHVYADGNIAGWFPNDDLRIKIVDADGNKWNASVYGSKEFWVWPIPPTSVEIDPPTETTTIRTP